MPRVKSFDENEVLIKAMNLFWKQGYSATSIQDLVNHLGINRASLYDTFGDKEQLFNKSFELYKQLNVTGLNCIFQEQPNVKQGFSILFSKAIQEAVLDVDCKGCFVVNTTTEFIPGNDEIYALLENNKAVVEKIFYDYLLKGKKEGQISTKQDLKSLASLLYTIYAGLRVVSRINPKKDDLSKSVHVALSLLS
jgi:TetR/AcrR family transcriptional repressor of nem operon